MYYRWIHKKLILDCRIQPKANEDCFSGIKSECLKIRITATPVDGKANKHLIKFLSKKFKTPQSNIEILRGQNSRDKLISITALKRLPPELKITDLK